MREIKFRAWDKKEKKMIYPNQDERDLVYSFNDGNLWFISKGDWQDVVDIIFMQYTGLKDRNGEEIYEGDIIKTKGNPKDKFDEQGTSIDKVIWDENELCWFAHGLLHKSCKVIGNIYENPELIK